MKATVTILAALAGVAISAPVEDSARRSPIQFEKRENSKPTTASESNLPQPAVKMPWKEPGVTSQEYGPWGFDDETCGTQRYCEAFKEYRSRTDKKFNTTKECFGAHEPRPIAE